MTLRLRMTILPVLAAVTAAIAFQQQETARWEQHARSITIVRDDWGIAHVYGKTDADAVFGAIYAQAEDDFNRVETNYLNSMGRLAEAEGEAKIWQDLRMKLFIDPVELRQNFAASPPWLQKLMTAWADGLNFYLLKHPEVKPRVIKRFEPWMALSFTEGSIGGDIETINLGQLEAFYGKKTVVFTPNEDVFAEPRGSNGMAVAPSNTSGKRALLLINPHTSFFFRSELQMVSEEGLNAYGASTWGQFFIYQGFNDRAGWMHTSSNVDAIDEYLETVTKKGDAHVYRYGSEQRPVLAKEIALPYRGGERRITVYRTHHGPIVREANGKWVAVRLMHEPVKALQQSYLRTKARNYAEYRKTMELMANSSNNTIYADADGTIAYFHGNYIPRRDTKFDWRRPVDGATPATEWNGLHPLEEIPQLRSPKAGWLYNANDWPWDAAGPDSPKKDAFPAYVEEGGASPRGRHAVMVLEKKKDFTLDSLIAAAYDSYLPYFEQPLPALVKAWDAAPASDPLKAKTAEQVALLRKWNIRWAVDSVPTSLAVFWAEELRRSGGRGASPAAMAPERLLQALAAASDKLAADFGKWQTPWGDINRFQRITGDIVHPFNDAQPSIPVGFTSAGWGSLASFGARPHPGTKKWYGTSGNSFVAVVEFGPRVRAKAVTAGGESGHPGTKHFNDQAQRYSTGALRDVYFYRDQLKGHTEREYHPGN
jgi:acyl-homoserine lactone acylase PvdQ